MFTNDVIKVNQNNSIGAHQTSNNNTDMMLAIKLFETIIKTTLIAPVSNHLISPTSPTNKSLQTLTQKMKNPNPQNPSNILIAITEHIVKFKTIFQSERKNQFQLLSEKCFTSRFAFTETFSISLSSVEAEGKRNKFSVSRLIFFPSYSAQSNASTSLYYDLFSSAHFFPSSLFNERSLHVMFDSRT